jgi:hypothetical protein
MYTNVNLAAPVGALAFLGTCFLLFIAASLFVYSLVKGRFRWTKLVLLASAVIVGIYVAVILVFSFASTERVLARGQEKHFCEIDCHLAYSITDVSQAKTLGNLTTPMTAAGVYTLITVKTRFDETTTSTNRGNGLLYPNSRVSTIIDE